MFCRSLSSPQEWLVTSPQGRREKSSNQGSDDQEHDRKAFWVAALVLQFNFIPEWEEI